MTFAVIAVAVTLAVQAFATVRLADAVRHVHSPAAPARDATEAATEIRWEWFLSCPTGCPGTHHVMWEEQDCPVGDVRVAYPDHTLYRRRVHADAWTIVEE